MSFSKKAAEIMHYLQSDYGEFKVVTGSKKQLPLPKAVRPCRHICSAAYPDLTPSNKRKLITDANGKTPATIRPPPKSTSAHRATTERKVTSATKFEPLLALTFNPNKPDLNSIADECAARKNEAELIIANTHTESECIRQLLKMVHDLCEELAESERMRLNQYLLMEGSKKGGKKQEKDIVRLEG
jgi:hypothetical protein